MDKKNKIIEKLLETDSGINSKYDCAVMFTGGKDSSYLLWALKKIYKKNVLAITIDNGFEDQYSQESAKRICKILNVEQIIVKEDKKLFATFYKTMIEEHGVFEELYKGDNHVCQICSYIIWCIAANVATENDVPILVSGVDISQIDSLGIEFNEINEMTNKIISKAYRWATSKTIKLFYKTYAYKTDVEFRKFIDNTLSYKGKVKTIFPFRFLDYNVDKIKEIITKEINFVPPVKGQSINEYISSGCKIIDALYDIEGLGLIDLNRKKYFEVLEDMGSLANYNVVPKAINIENEIFDELEIKDFIKNECIKANINIKK